MKTKIEILNEIFEPEIYSYLTEKKDLQLAITLNPDVDDILKAMETYATQQTSDLTTQLAKANSDKGRLGVIVKDKVKELEKEADRLYDQPFSNREYDIVCEKLNNYRKTLQDCGITI